MILDVCCGSRMFWFTRQDDRAVYLDNRNEEHSLKDSSVIGGTRHLAIAPDVIADFTALPFDDNSFEMVVFDPPHLIRAGRQSWMAKKYGKLEGDWPEMLRKGFRECFRVLRPSGTLIFKWNETQIPVSRVLALTDERPVIGQRCGKTARTHWIVFMKSEAS
jgi:SAM-dependent methyltransferase